MEKKSIGKYIDEDTDQQEIDAELEDLKEKETSQLALAWMRFKRSKLALIGGLIVLVLVITAIFAPFIAPYDPLETNPQRRLEDPSSEHLLGTDNLGRDIFSRLVYGTRIALMIGVLIVAVSGGIGITLGVLAGVFGGWIDEAIMRLVDTFLAFPTVVMALAIAGALGPGLYNVIIAVGLVVWTRFARVTRGDILSIKTETYIEAAEAIGESKISLITKYYIPNVLPSIVVVATIMMPTALLASAALTFLGIGAQAPDPSWGYMVSSGRDYLTIAPWMATFGGASITVTVLAFNFVGDGLRDALDPVRGGS